VLTQDHTLKYCCLKHRTFWSITRQPLQILPRLSGCPTLKKCSSAIWLNSNALQQCNDHSLRLDTSEYINAYYVVTQLYSIREEIFYLSNLPVPVALEMFLTEEAGATEVSVLPLLLLASQHMLLKSQSNTQLVFLSNPLPSVISSNIL